MHRCSQMFTVYSGERGFVLTRNTSKRDVLWPVVGVTGPQNNLTPVCVAVKNLCHWKGLHARRQCPLSAAHSISSLLEEDSNDVSFLSLLRSDCGLFSSKLDRLYVWEIEMKDASSFSKLVPRPACNPASTRGQIGTDSLE